MPDIGVPELIIVAVIILLLFGPGKAADLGSSLGKGIREFRKATRDDADDPTPSTLASTTSATPAAGVVVTSTPSAPMVMGASPEKLRFCTECGGQNVADAKFCIACGRSMVVPA